MKRTSNIVAGIIIAVCCSFGSGGCAAPETYNPGDPGSREYYLHQLLNCATGSASCASSAALGGTVTGLLGSIKLSDGSETLTISADGTFSFAGSRSIGSSYQVASTLQPAGQLCSLTGTAGAISTTSSAAVTVTCTTVLYVGGIFGTFNGTAQTGLTRLLETGARDTSFDTGTGFLGATGRVNDVEASGDGTGDVYVGGDYTTYQGQTANRIVRLQSNGTINTGFTSGTGFDGPIYALASLRDGSGQVYVGGDFTAYNGSSRNRIVRLNGDGSLDASFSIGTGFDMVVRAITPAADGSGDIYIGGDFTTYNSVGGFNRIMRLNSDGSADTSFATSGGNNPVHAVVNAADGSGDVYVGGNFTNFNSGPVNRILRMNSDGTTDGAFNIGLGADGLVAGIALANDGTGDVYLASSAANYRGNNTFNMVRINSDGSWDPGLSMSTGFTSFTNAAYMALDGSGRFFMGGDFTNFNGSGANRILGLNSDGTVNSSFSFGTGFDAEVVTIGH